MHGDLLHLGGNVYWLWTLGAPLERLLGAPRYLALLLASAVVSSSFELAMSDDTGIGASGVVYAVFGWLWVGRRHDPRCRSILDARTVQLFLFWLGACVVLTKLDMLPVANAAHVSGLLLGAAAGAARMRSMPDPRASRLSRVGIAGLAALGVLAAVPLVWCPWSPTWLSHEAYEAHVAEDYDTAIRYYTLVLAIDAENAWAYLNRGYAYASLGDLEKAEADLERAREIEPGIDDEEDAETLDQEPGSGS